MPKTQISVPGILVKMTIDKKSYKFHFFLANGSPANPMFYTSPALRDAIKQIPKEDIIDTHIGQITYTNTEKNKHSEHYYPLDAYLDFRKKGIALALEKIALRELRKKIGNAPIHPLTGAGEERVKQIKRRGIPVQTDEGGRSQYKTTVNKLLNGIKKIQKEYKKAHRPQTPQERWARMQALGMKPRTRKPKPNKRH
jgi:hypothetical protein